DPQSLSDLAAPPDPPGLPDLPDPPGHSSRPHRLLLLERQAATVAANHDRVSLGEITLEDAQRQGIEQPPLNRPLARAGNERRHVALLDQTVLRGVGEHDMNLPLFEPLGEAGDLDVDNPLHVFAAERVEEDDLVDPVQELRAEVLPERVHDLAPG